MRRFSILSIIGGLLLFGLVSCTTPLDMSGDPLAPPGPEWGLVIGSVLVQPEKDASGNDTKGRDVFGSSYEFAIVHIQPGDPNGEHPYAQQFRLDATAGEERIFISSLRPGEYLIKTFKEDAVRGLGGELGLVFASEAGEVRYIGRVRVEIPDRISKGKGYRFTVENAREATLEQVSRRHAVLMKNVQDKPMHSRERLVP